MEYKACIKVFQDLNFSKNAISFCCWESRSNIPAFPIDGEKFKLDEFLDFRLKTIEQFKNGHMSCPPTCEHLIIANWPEDLTPKIAIVAMNNFTACNCDCYYCTIKNTGTSKYKPIDYLAELATRRHYSKNCIFSWGGGEVTTYTGFEQELKLSLYLKFRNVIHTNGIIFSPLIAKALQQNTSLHLSPDSGTAETYLKVKGVDKFNEVKNNIKLYSKCGKKIHLKYIINEHNCTIQDIKGFVEICETSPNIEAEISLTSEVTNSKKYDENQFLHLYMLVRMLNSKKIPVSTFSPFFLEDAREKFSEFCNAEKYKKLRDLFMLV